MGDEEEKEDWTGGKRLNVPIMNNFTFRSPPDCKEKKESDKNE
jgi:hypothetical protein